MRTVYHSFDCADFRIVERLFTPSLEFPLRTLSTSRSRMRSGRMAAGQLFRRKWPISALSTCLPCDLYPLTSHRELLDYLAKLVDKRLVAPKDDLISKLAVEQLKPGHIQHSDAVQIAFLLLVAGNATMVNMIALVSLLSSFHFDSDALPNNPPPGRYRARPPPEAA